MSDPPEPGRAPVETDPELLRAFREQCKLVGQRWRLQDDAKRAAARELDKVRRRWSS